MPIGDKVYNVEINDSELEREGWKNSRYKGTKLTGAKINKFTQGDITFGTNPVIEQFSKTVYVFNQADTSFESLAGIFYPTEDEFTQTLTDKSTIGATRFKIDRAVTFTVGQPNNFSQIEPGTNKDDPSFNYFDTLLKTDLALFNSCSVRFFDNANNGFVKPLYSILYNRGDFKPAAAYFQSSSTNTDIVANAGENKFTVNISDGGRLYINPNIEDWFISQDGASGSQGTLGAGNTAITINHSGSTNSINSSVGYFFGLSSRLKVNEDSYYISFDGGNQGVGTLNEKNLLKAFDIHELEDSGSNFTQTLSPVASFFNIKTTGRYGSTFANTYDGSGEEEFVLFREAKSNNTVHLNFNILTEAPAGVGNGGVIIPDNLHPAIKESLNVYLGNAGLGAQGGSTAQFGLGGAVQSVNSANASQLTGPIGFQGSDIEESLAPARAEIVRATNLGRAARLGSFEAIEAAVSARATARTAVDTAETAASEASTAASEASTAASEASTAADAAAAAQSAAEQAQSDLVSALEGTGTQNPSGPTAF